ncbi:MAG: DUF2178 domain-containing protein [Methanomicrobiales archaeon]|nr:DUF2178 domain-containing protein [Methanomicrobiales archaeon]
MADYVWPLISFGIGFAIVLIGILYILLRIRDKKAGFALQDERSQKINGMAANYALHIGLYFMTGILFVLIIGREFFSMPDQGAGPVLIASMLVFSLTYLGLHLYFERQRDRV